MSEPTLYKKKLELKLASTFEFKLTVETIKKLEEAFAIDASIEEACLYANITKQTYYNWVKKYPVLKERFDYLREKLPLKARKVVADRLGDSYHTAMDYLKRKKRDEFGDSAEITHKLPVPILGDMKPKKIEKNGLAKNISDNQDSKPE